MLVISIKNNIYIYKIWFLVFNPNLKLTVLCKVLYFTNSIISILLINMDKFICYIESISQMNFDLKIKKLKNLNLAINSVFFNGSFYKPIVLSFYGLRGWISNE